jgi:hypothetical protein
MGPEKWKDEAPERSAEEDERTPGRKREVRSSEDEREDEGWTQPESSAQKGTGPADE